MNDSQLLDRLASANAYPADAAAPEQIWTHDLALRELDRRISMDTRQHTPVATEPKRRRTGWLVAAAAFALVLLVGGGIALLTAGGTDTPPADEPTTTQAPTTTAAAPAPTTTVAAIAAEVVVVDAANEARNSGDIEAYLEFLEGELLSIEEIHNISKANSYANYRMELVDCKVTGATATSMPAQEDSLNVECEATETDDFYGAGGIVVSGTAIFKVTKHGKIIGFDLDDGSEAPWDEREGPVFTKAFWAWLMDAHPTVFAGISAEFFDPALLPGLRLSRQDRREPAEMAIAVDYVSEFVAQSDEYPLNP